MTKNNCNICNKQTNISLLDKDLKLIKEFFLRKINSPFINLDYEIKKGDSIQKILQKLKVKNSEIQTVINQYKKYGNPNQLLTGNRIEIIAQKSRLAKRLSDLNKDLRLKKIPYESYESKFKYLLGGKSVEEKKKYFKRSLDLK